MYVLERLSNTFLRNLVAENVLCNTTWQLPVLCESTFPSFLPIQFIGIWIRRNNRIIYYLYYPWTKSATSYSRLSFKKLNCMCFCIHLGYLREQSEKCENINQETIEHTHTYHQFCSNVVVSSCDYRGCTIQWMRNLKILIITFQITICWFIWIISQS